MKIMKGSVLRMICEKNIFQTFPFTEFPVQRGFSRRIRFEIFIKTENFKTDLFLFTRIFLTILCKVLKVGDLKKKSFIIIPF